MRLMHFVFILLMTSMIPAQSQETAEYWRSDVSMNTNAECWMKYLEKGFITNNTSDTKSENFSDISAYPVNLCAGSVPLSILQRAKASVDATPVSTSGNFTAYAHALKDTIRSLNGQIVEMWIVDYPAQLPIVGQTGKPIPSGTTIALFVRDSITIPPKSWNDESQSLDVIGLDNVNPPWVGIEKPFDIERDVTFNATTMETMQELSVARVTKIELLK